mmetsp:Transcript_8738/g.16576  ORF Transcript_8738/g.16576 Transcript_8738/m.16576 type:complete len:238 (-) Transcript_8738:3-716(-)
MGRHRRDIQDGGELDGALDVEVGVGQRLHEVLEGGLVKVLVALGVDFLRTAGPNGFIVVLDAPIPDLVHHGLHDWIHGLRGLILLGGALVGLFLFFLSHGLIKDFLGDLVGLVQFDGEGDELTVLLDQARNEGRVAERRGVLLQMKRDADAALHEIGGVGTHRVLGNGELVTAGGGLPQPLLIIFPTAGLDTHFVGDEERGIETDAELANEVVLAGAFFFGHLHEAAGGGKGKCVPI